MDATASRSAHPRVLSTFWSTLLSWLAWLGSRKLELAVLLLGVALRVSMRYRYEPTGAYDFPWHWELVEWMIEHRRVAPAEAVFQAQHPPLFYTIAALLFANGVSLPNMAWLPVTCGVIRLGLTWAAIELYLPHSRWARVSALALAASIAASVHVDGMIYPEAVNCLWASIAILLAPQAFRSSSGRRLAIAALLGLVLGVEMLTKVSGLTILAALCAVGGLELVFSRDPLVQRLRAALRWVAMVSLCLAVCGWYYARNVAEYGRPFVTSFDLPSQRNMVEASNQVPYLHRRTLGYFLGWEPAIYSFPFGHAATGANATFFPAAVASAFVDYWNYGFNQLSPVGKSGPRHPAVSTPPDILRFAQYAVLGGTIIFAATVAAWLAVSRHLWQRRDWGRMSLVSIPLVMLLAALHFATTYPVDTFGVIKSAYLQYGSGPLCGLYGVSVGWSHKRLGRWPLLVVLLGALWLVAAYTIYCRFRIPILPE
ncbi:MAG: hypothetical protein RL033_2326 [Pseudomonadota bacterium]